MRRRTLAALLLLAVAAGVLAPVGAQGFSIARVELVFVNRRGDITVPHRFPNLRAYAMVRAGGLGVIQGHWKVDGRIIGTTAHPTTFGDDAILVSPELPTSEPGLHRVTLDVSSPRPAFAIPEITYFVTAQDYQEWRERQKR